MAVAIPNQWPGTFADTDGEIVANPTPGRMLVAVIASRVLDGSAPTLAVGDVSRNGWMLLSDPLRPASVPHVAGQLQVEVWGCPSARYDGWPWQLIYASAMQITASDVGSGAVTVLEVSGTTGQITVDSVTPFTASAATSLAMTAPAPTGGANCLMVAAAVADVATAATPSGTGWTALTGVTNSNPTVGLASAWREATTGGTVTFTLGTSQNWAGVVVALRTSGTVLSQPNPAWPATSLQIGLGYDLSTPLSRVRWTDQTTRYLSLNSSRGIQAELNTAQAGQTVLKLKNHDGAYSPRPVALAAPATAAGTTSTIALPTATITAAGSVINPNTTFDVDVAGWSTQGSTLARSTAVVNTAQGAIASMLITPDGVTAAGGAVDALSGVGTVAPGVSYKASMWANSPGGWSDIRTAVDWYDGSGALVSTSFGTQTNCPAGVWTFMTDTFTAPAGAVQARMRARHGGTPPVGAIWYAWAVRLTLAADITTGNIHVADFFRLKTAAGALKQLDVFQVTGLATSAGTTTVTFTRADGSGAALAATATGDVYAGIAIDLYIPWRLLHTVAGITYVAASGWLRDLPLEFADAHYSTVSAQGADAIETTTAANPSALRGEIYRRPGLYAYWPLDDATGTGYASNASGVSNAPLTQTVSKYGAGSMTAGFGASTQDVENVDATVTDSVYGDTATGWAQSGGVAADLATKGYALVGNDPGFPPITGGVTIFGCMMATDLDPIINGTADPTVCIIRNADPAAGVGQGSVIKVSISHDFATAFQAKVTVWDKATHATTVTTCGPVQIAPGGWVTWALTFNQTSWALYQNTQSSPVGSGSCNLVATWSGLDVGGEADQFFHGRAFSAVHAHIAVYGRRLTLQETSNLGSVVLLGTPANELSSARASRKLNTAGVKGTRIVNTSVTTDSIEDTPSGTVIDLLSTLASWEDSAVFADAANQIQFRSRVTAYQQKPVAVLGDGPGEIPYQPGQVYDFNPTFIYSQTSIENTSIGNGLIVGTSTLVAIDDVSAAKYPGRTLPRQTRLQRLSDAWHLGWWLLARYAYPRQRVGTVTVSGAATTDTARWAFVCGVDIGDLLVINRRPIGQPAISIRCKVLSVAPTFDRTSDPATGQVTLTLAAEPSTVPIANDATYGVVGGTVLGV